MKAHGFTKKKVDLVTVERLSRDHEAAVERHRSLCEAHERGEASFDDTWRAFDDSWAAYQTLLAEIAQQRKALHL